MKISTIVACVLASIAAASLAVVVRDNVGHERQSRSVEVDRPGTIVAGAPLYSHPYRVGDEPASRSAGGPIEVVRYQGNGSVSIRVEGRLVDAEAADVTVRYSKGCTEPMSSIVSARHCRS